MGILNDMFFGGSKKAYEAEAGAWKRYAQEGEQRSDRQLSRIEHDYDNIADKGYEAYDKAADAMIGGYNTAVGQYAPYSGTEAHELRANLSGANGPAAQQAAYDDYIESPSVAWARERGMQAINRDSAAVGGTNAGNRLKALSAWNQNISQQGFEGFWGRLGEIAGTSFNAATNIAALREAEGVNRSGLEERRGAFDTNLGVQRSALYRGQQTLGDQMYLDSIQGTGVAKANKAGAEGAGWGSIGGMALSSASAAIPGGSMLSGIAGRFGKSVLDTVGGSLMPGKG